MNYNQLTSPERYAISALRKEGLGPRAIARRLGRHPSTIYREYARNTKRDGSYRAQYAISRASGRRTRSRMISHFSWDDFALVEQYLRKRWSPQQISGFLARDGTLFISYETIYKYVWWDKLVGGELYTCLRGAQKKRWKRYRSRDSRGILPGKRHITERPDVVDARSRVGDWEVDTVMGSGDKHCILTMVDRRSGYTLIGKLRNRRKEAANAAMLRMVRMQAEKFATITADNGTEFHGYIDVEDSTGVPFYFATPYHSWERGTNENTNGLIRQYLPKGQSMADLTQRRCNWIAKQLNERPRKRHEFKSPKEIYESA